MYIIIIIIERKQFDVLLEEHIKILTVEYENPNGTDM